MTEDLKYILLLSLVVTVLTLCLLVVVIAAYTVKIILNIQEAKNPIATQEVLTPAKPKLTLWQQLDRRFITAAVPVEQEKSILLHHDYDGIQELDNHLPPWWTGLFYGTIGFAAVYLLIFHVWNTSPLQIGEYAAELEQAKVSLAAYQAKAANLIDETNVAVDSTPEALASGKMMFSENCRACHGAAGQGGVGPNLTDEYWIHGGDVKSVFKTIKNGVPEKGMISWKAKFKPAEMRSLSSYILSLQGTNPAGAKAPQGERSQPNSNSQDPRTDSASPAATPLAVMQ